MVGVASFGGTAAFVGRVADDQLGKVFAHDLRARGRRVLDAAPATDGDADRPLPRHRHARRRAHAEHVPRRVGRARARRRRRRARGERAGALPRGLPLGRARREGRVPPRGAARARRGQPGRVHALRRASASTGTATSSSSSSSTRSTCCSPTRTRSRRSTRSTTSTTRSQRVHDHCEIAALTRSAKGSVIVDARRGARDRRGSGRRARRHHRRRRPLRRRVPLRAHARLRPRHRRAARCARGGGGDLAPRCRVRRRRSRSWRARCSNARS